jgi:hypothetical protein
MLFHVSVVRGSARADGFGSRADLRASTASRPSLEAMSEFGPAGRKLPKSEGPLFPPRLAQVVWALVPENPVLAALGYDAFAATLTAIFFASLQTEEGEHYPIRVALTGGRPSREAVETSTPGWRHVRFRRPCPCSTRHLLRLSRAARSERLFITIARAGGGLAITGLAREGLGEDDGTLIKVHAPEPGCLDIWVSGRRVLEYARGHIQTPPEDVLLSSGRVRDKLLAFATQASSPAGYIESIASIIRHLADHPHGGILVLSAEDEPWIPEEASFAPESDTHLWDVLHELSIDPETQRTAPGRASEALRREAMRAEIERSVGEIGHMTALDGGTILDRRLGVRGFGIVLPVRSDVTVVEVMDAAATVRAPFALDQYGARHRAAASYAATHAGSLVFIASASGDLGCMLRDEETETVLMWRFRSGDLSSPGP